MKSALYGTALYALGLTAWAWVAEVYWHSHAQLGIGTDAVLLLLLVVYGLGVAAWPVPFILDWWRWRGEGR